MTSLPVLAVNVGSSSVKWGLYEAGAGGAECLYERSAPALGDLRPAGFPEPVRIGHRLVHGGPKLRTHQRLTDAVWADLQAAVPFAPLHLPAALAALEHTRQLFPQATQTICLDTAFHRHLPEVARRFALPDIAGVERYGFHGLALESVVAQLRPVPRRLIACHLGSGCSVTAIRDGVSIDTSMGLTPTGGVMMSTRSGDLDPGVLLYLLRTGVTDLEPLVDQRAGLLGVSGGSADMRTLLAARGTDARAALAVAMFCYQVRKAIAAMAAALGGVDRVVFSGGIGENSAVIRAEIAAGLEFLSAPIAVVPAREDRQIALHAATAR